LKRNDAQRACQCAPQSDQSACTHSLLLLPETSLRINPYEDCFVIGDHVEAAVAATCTRPCSASFKVLQCAGQCSQTEAQATVQQTPLAEAQAAKHFACL
jgi:hypothetical protein